jgi:hypothetical protein
MARDQSEKPIFQEWQLPSGISFLPHTMVLPAIWLVFAPINADLGLLVGILLTLLSIAIRLVTSKRIRVTQAVLEVGAASIPRVFLGAAEVVIESEQFSQKGPKLDSRAFVALKGLRGLVRVTNTDQSDPTPYLLISSRRPEELKKALSS